MFNPDQDEKAIDARCAMLARCAVADARYLAMRNFMRGESAKHMRFCIVAFADRIIAIRSQQAASC